MKEIIHGECLEAMRRMPDASFTTVVTDPPYALEFMGKGWDKVLPSVDIWREAFRVTKPGGMLLAFGGTRTFHRLTCAIEDAGWQIRDCLCWLYGTGFPKSLGVGKAIDRAAGATREVLGMGAASCPYLKRGEQCRCHEEGERAQAGKTQHQPATVPATDAAKLWDGYGTALKPAWEPIVLAMKPFDGTFANNAMAYGVAGINVDGCRIPHKTVGSGNLANNPHLRTSIKAGTSVDPSSFRITNGKDVELKAHSAGRWPANVVLDEEAARELDEQVGILKSGKVRKDGRHVRRQPKFRNAYGDFEGQEVEENAPIYGDSGGASRFFYCAKASKQDRGPDNRHPTVKPIELMRWLVRMVTMPTGTRVLDPFCGSGSTGVACAMEGVDFVGIEREAEYVEIARRRINAPL